MRILGIDEAGRGCVLGALVVGAYLIDAGDEDALEALGVNDSKKLSKKKRARIRANLGSVGASSLSRTPMMARPIAGMCRT